MKVFLSFLAALAVVVGSFFAIVAVVSQFFKSDYFGYSMIPCALAPFVALSIYLFCLEAWWHISAPTRHLVCGAFAIFCSTTVIGLFYWFSPHNY